MINIYNNKYINSPEGGNIMLMTNFIRMKKKAAKIM